METCGVTLHCLYGASLILSLCFDVRILILSVLVVYCLSFLDHVTYNDDLIHYGLNTLLLILLLSIISSLFGSLWNSQPNSLTATVMFFANLQF